MYAVVEIQGSQFKVEKNQKLFVNRIDAKEGSKVCFDKVLLVEDLITDGSSKYNFIEAVEEVGGRIKAIFVIFNYGINKEFLEYNGKKIKIISLAKWEDVLKMLNNWNMLQCWDIWQYWNVLD